jgi:hypothetical protein
MYNSVQIDSCPICKHPYSQKNYPVIYHITYPPNEQKIYACRACNYAEFLLRHWSRHVNPWQWWRMSRVKEFRKIYKIPETRRVAV